MSFKPTVISMCGTALRGIMSVRSLGLKVPLVLKVSLAQQVRQAYKVPLALLGRQVPQAQSLVPQGPLVQEVWSPARQVQLVQLVQLAQIAQSLDPQVHKARQAQSLAPQVQLVHKAQQVPSLAQQAQPERLAQQVQSQDPQVRLVHKAQTARS